MITHWMNNWNKLKRSEVIKQKQSRLIYVIVVDTQLQPILYIMALSGNKMLIGSRGLQHKPEMLSAV